MQQASRPELPYLVRRLKREDLPLVARTWVEGSRMSAAWCPEREHDQLYRRSLDAVLHRALGCDVAARRGESDLWVCPNPSNDDRIWAWACANVRQDQVALHWVWVRDEFRRMGLATRLVATILQESGSRLVWTSWSKMGALFVAARPEAFLEPPAGYRPDLFRP